jgi:hypothetical protein
MSPCCQPKPKPLRRPLMHALAGWMIPSIVFCLMPKCPLCLVAYFTIATGFVLPLTLASGLHKSLITLCIVSLLLGMAVFARLLVPQLLSMNKNREV